MASALTGRPMGVPVMEIRSPTGSETSLSTRQGQQDPLPSPQQQPPRNRSRARRSPSRLPLRTAFRDFSGTVEILVGDDGDKSRPQTKYMVHKELLTAASPFFAAALDGAFAEGLEQIVKLPEEKAEIFEWFLQWLYTGSLTIAQDGAFGSTALMQHHQQPHYSHIHNHHHHIPPDHPYHAHHARAEADALARTDGDLRNHVGSPKYFLLIDLYALSDRLLTAQLSNHILTTIARLSETTNSVPTPSDTFILYDGIRDSSPLRTLVLDLFAYKKTDKLLETHKDEWHPLFLRALVVKLKRPGPEAIERHALEAWRPESWSASKSCEGCKEILKPGVLGGEK
ncbi:hypothetical protein B0A55_05339 [Friedmanniomyces simplex]|uniref:BTB domain-containing protein n=1 Tax=Friedmanniomyces simplex TaxID=329884 RepID=A0A4U0XJE3_9PEZI|nr:hypothetical protein B0A55_05339 [Friedmanniomyces simplex]